VKFKPRGNLFHAHAHEAVVYSKTGVKKDGTLMAREMTILLGRRRLRRKEPDGVFRGSLPHQGRIAFRM